MLGMPVVLPPGASKPPPPPPPAAPAEPVYAAPPPSRLPPPPPPPSLAPAPAPAPAPPRDATDELAALDLDQVDAVLGAGADDLDYDDLAETKAVDVQSVMRQGLAAATAPAPAPSQPPQGFAPAPQGFAPSQPPQGFEPAPQGFAPSQAPAPLAPSSPGVATSPGTEEAPAPKKKKSQVGLFLLVGLLGFCGLASAAGVGGYFYLQSKAEDALRTIAATPLAPAVPDAPPIPTPSVVDTAPAPVEPTAAPPAAPAEVEWALNTSPAGVRVTIAGRTDTWTTPAVLRLPPGSYVVTLQADGYVTNEQALEMRANGGSFFTLTPSAPAPAVVAANEPAPGGDRGSERSGSERSGSERSGSERSGGDRGSDRSGNERSGGQVAAAPPPAAPATQSPFDALREAARGHFAAGRFREAAAAYERAAALNPGHAGTFAGLGASRLKLNDARGAVVAYEKAVQLQPTSAPFFAALGRAHLQAGNRTAARAAFQRALTLDPNNGAARQNMEQLGG
jgi:hypothetical protein